MKKQVLKVKVLMCLIGISMIWYSCQKESDIIEKYEVSFNILSESASDLKNSEAYELNDAEKVIITVQENDGTPTDYTQYELNVNKLGDAFITKKIALQLGSYKVTEFYIIDGLDSIIYASPLEGSLMAQNVADPLPIFFDITEKLSNAVNVEVISTKNLKPEDFGLIRFPIVEVETFQFLINVSELGIDQLLIADLIVASGSYTYSQELDSIVDNIVTVKDGYSEYVISVTKSGYTDYIDTITNSELKLFETIPVVVELEKINIPIEGLVAYYPFNGDANDESGHGNNGTINGATLTTDRNGNLNTAYDFDGNDFINIADSPILDLSHEFTISVWISTNNVGSHPYHIIKKGQQADTRYTNYRIGIFTDHPAVEKRVHLGMGNASTYYGYYMSTDSIIDNNWTHVIATYNGDDKIVNIYIDGVLNNVYINIPMDPITGDWSLRIGDDYGRDFFEGQIDDIRIYDRALSVSEIQALYNE